MVLVVDRMRVINISSYLFTCKICESRFEVKNWDYETNQIVTCYNCGAIMETESFSGGSCYSAWTTEVIGSVHDDGIWVY